MSKANPAVIGGFVIGAIALVVLGLLAFGGTNWFAKRNEYVAYFPGSVKGLQVGAPVDFRGVSIGRVTDIKVLFNPDQVSARIPVVMEFDPTQIEVVGREPIMAGPEGAKRLIDGGFRAQLQSQSLLTGLLFVNLDFLPKSPVRLVGGEQPYPEIPTIPSEFEQLQQTAGDVAARMPELLDRLNGLLTDLNATLNQTSGGFGSVVSDVAAIAQDVRKSTPEVVASAEKATEELQHAAQTLDDILQTNRDAIGTLIDEWTVTGASMRRVADQVNATLAENREGLRDFTQNGLYEYTGLAQDAQRLVDQFTRLGEQIERDPARFLFGDRWRQGVQPE
jgi:phospholipid/cholesterol/gamma-HCH transport system substrate-binding protein